MAIIAGTSSQSHNTSCVIVAAVFIFMFSFFFPTGFLGLTFLYASEISPLSVRVPITSISTGSAWLFNFLVAEITPVGFATLGYKYYIIYACINFFLILPGKQSTHIRQRHLLTTVKQVYTSFFQRPAAVTWRKSIRSSLIVRIFSRLSVQPGICQGEAHPKMLL